MCQVPFATFYICFCRLILTTISISEMWNPKHREFKKRVPGHTDSKWQSQHRDVGSRAPKCGRDLNHALYLPPFPTISIPLFLVKQAFFFPHNLYYLENASIILNNLKIECSWEILSGYPMQNILEYFVYQKCKHPLWSDLVVSWSQRCNLRLKIYDVKFCRAAHG